MPDNSFRIPLGPVISPTPAPPVSRDRDRLWPALADRGLCRQESRPCALHRHRRGRHAFVLTRLQLAAQTFTVRLSGLCGRHCLASPRRCGRACVGTATGGACAGRGGSHRICGPRREFSLVSAPGCRHLLAPCALARYASTAPRLTRAQQRAIEPHRADARAGARSVSARVASCIDAAGGKNRGAIATAAGRGSACGRDLGQRDVLRVAPGGVGPGRPKHGLGARGSAAARSN